MINDPVNDIDGSGSFQYIDKQTIIKRWNPSTISFSTISFLLFLFIIPISSFIILWSDYSSTYLFIIYLKNASDSWIAVYFFHYMLFFVLYVYIFIFCYSLCIFNSILLIISLSIFDYKRFFSSTIQVSCLL